MAVPGSRKRSADKGHHSLGTEITLSDGTLAFLPYNTLSGVDGGVISTETIGGRTSLAVNVHHVDDIVINQLAHNVEGVSTTLAADAAAGATQIVVTSATGIVVGTRLALIEGNSFQQTLPYVTAAAGTTLTLDGPLDCAFTAAGATVYVALVNMAPTVGSLAAPIAYRIRPHSTENWDITRMNFSMVHGSAADDSKFGSIDALEHGVVIRSITALDGVRTLTNMKSNQQIREDMFDVVYSDKAGGGKFGTSGRWSIQEKTGAIIRLNGSDGDYLEVLVQDDISILTDFQMKWQGHINEV